MRVGISLDAYRKCFLPAEGVRKIAAAGFDAIDLNLSDWCFPKTPFIGDRWESWVREIGDAAGECGIPFSQAHAPIYPWLDETGSDVFLDLLTERTLKTCEMLDIPFAVCHPRFPKVGCLPENHAEIREANVLWFSKWAALAGDCGVSLAVENLFDFFNGRITSYGRNADELIDLVDAVGSDHLGICLDTGHANIVGHDPADMLRTCGPLLKVLHIHDNDGKSDQHVAPYVGNIDWPAFAQALRDTDFQGVFSLEVHCYVQRMPIEIIDDAVALAQRIARHVVGLRAAPTDFA